MNLSFTESLGIHFLTGAVCVKISTSVSGEHTPDRYVVGAFDCGALVRSIWCEPGGY